MTQQGPRPTGAGDQPKARVFNDRYELVRHVARGGMAQVYLAKDLLLDRPVALKVLFPELSVDRSFVERFRREAQAAANLAHPHIVSIYDWGEGEHTYYIVMEYIDGRTLAQMLRQGPLDGDQAASIAADVAAALSFAHSNGVIHRDVKPANVLIDRTGQVKVTDFGIARAVGTKEGLTQAGTVMGTATYFSPEQAQGYSVDARSDVYSLGVVLYEMVTGRAPFAGDNPVAIAYKHVREEAIAPTQVNRAVPPSLEAIILQAMAKDPDQRYQSADELRADLTRYLQGSSVLAHPAMSSAAMGTTHVQPSYQATRVGATAGTYIDDRPVQNGRRSGAYVVVLALMLGVLAVLLYLLGRQLGVFGGSSAARVTIPQDIIGKPVADATTELEAHGLDVRATSNEGEVVSSNPPPGTIVNKNSTVILTVTPTPTTVPVPDVRSLDVDKATSVLRQAGFLTTTEQQNSPTAAINTVIDTLPASGSPQPKGSSVTLLVSTGQVKIPLEAGKDEATAGNDLGAIGLKVSRASEPSDTIAAGKVTRTNPPADALVNQNSTVTIFVSTGQQEVKVPVPSTISETSATAQAQLSAAGFNVQVTRINTSDPTNDGIVVGQSPNGGQAARGSTVTISVGRFVATTTAPKSTTTSSTSTTTP